jgi:gluconolactonase
MRIRLFGAALCMVPLIACGATITDDRPTSTGTPPPESEAPGPLDGRTDLERVETDLSFVELEGPQWIQGEGVLLFSDVSANVIYRLSADNQFAVFRKPSRFSNGLAVDPKGRLLAAEAGSRRVTRTEANGTVTPIADRFEGASLNQPNDIVARSDGSIYFTDPTFGEATAHAELDFRGVFRIAPDGRLTAEYRGETSETPNGIAFSPDESLLYVTDYDANLVRVFDVADDGTLSAPRTFVEVFGPDGMAVDQAGNLFVASYDTSSIEVFTPDGETGGEIDMPESPSNCAFGGVDGRTLYITTGTGLYRTTLAGPGIY